MFFNNCWAKPNNEIEIYNKIYHKISIGETDDAIKLCQKQIKRDKKNSMWPFLLGTAYFSQANYSEALELFSTLKPTREVNRYIKNCIIADSLMKNPLPYSLRYMGDSINTIYDNIWPSLTAKEDMFCTTVVVGKKNNSNPHDLIQEDIYYSLPLDSNKWTLSKAFSSVLNTPENEGSQSFSADDKYMFLVKCNQRDGLGGCDIYYCVKTPKGWSRPINAGNVINSRDWESTPSVSADGKTLYFSSNRRPNKGGKDLFMSEITVLDNGLLKFSNVKNLGDTINTFFDETAPFIHPDGKTLYFSSDGHPGMGGLDVFICRMDSNNNWSLPANMGYPLNTVRNEMGFCTNLSGDKGYLSAPKSNLATANMVIYEVSLPKQVRPNPTLFIKNKDSVQFSQISPGENIVLNNILFDFNDHKLVNESISELDKLAKILKDSPELNIIISGHTDSIGPATYNQELSMKRAVSVSEYLISKGIDKNRIQCKGYGDSMPLLPNSSEENRAKNRRIEIIIL